VSDSSRPGEDAPPRGMSTPRLRREATPGEQEVLLQLARDIPGFLRLLYRLALDPRVSAVDKGIVIATIGYIVWADDLIPDRIPFTGRLDDLFLLALALHRLLANAGTEVVFGHWEGSPRSLELALSALDTLGALLPQRVQELLRGRIG
jgi:uncharacterized membrane protein YkvA (DUF1232 family)